MDPQPIRIPGKIHFSDLRSMLILQATRIYQATSPNNFKNEQIFVDLVLSCIKSYGTLEIIPFSDKLLFALVIPTTVIHLKKQLAAVKEKNVLPVITETGIITANFPGLNAYPSPCEPIRPYVLCGPLDYTDIFTRDLNTAETLAVLFHF